MALREYLAGEVTTDFADGLLSRREALRRLGLLGLGVSAAGALLAACGGGDEGGDSEATTTTAADATRSTSASTSTSTGAAGATGEEVTFAGPKGDLVGVVAAAPGKPKGALLVIHENRGLTEHFRQLVARFAADGYTSLVVDLLSDQGGTAKLSDPAAAPAGLAARPTAELVADLEAGVTELQKRAPGAKVGVIGFCFGGGMAWQLVQDGDPRLAAVAPFYGPAPDAPDFTKSKAAVLGVYGELDSRVNASRDRARSALDAAGLTYDIKTYPGADHAFFNDAGARYNEQAAMQAKADVLAFFGEHLA
jgi:carboxymethylenebutenolidase